MPTIKFSEVMQCTDENHFRVYMRDTLAKFSPEDPPLISDCIVNYNNGGAPVIEYLSAVDDENRRRNLPTYMWKLEVLNGEWADTKPGPGDVVKRKHKRPLQERDGVPIPGSVLSNMKTDGSYEEELEYSSEFVVDEKGCITCGLHDAIHFLNLWGVHPSGKPITKKKPTSREPLLRNDGQTRHVMYRRYKEADKHRYSQMPKIKKAQNA